MIVQPHAERFRAFKAARVRELLKERNKLDQSLELLRSMPARDTPHRDRIVSRRMLKRNQLRVQRDHADHQLRRLLNDA